MVREYARRRAGAGHPRVLALFVHRHRWRRQLRIGEGADWDGNGFVGALGVKKHCRAADWAKVEMRARSFVAGQRETGRRSRDIHLTTRESGLCSKHAAAATLAIHAVADRDAQRVAARSSGELTATAGGKARWHGGSTTIGLASGGFTATNYKPPSCHPPLRCGTCGRGRRSPPSSCTREWPAPRFVVARPGPCSWPVPCGNRD